jgi:cystathionine beta-lyase
MFRARKFIMTFNFDEVIDRRHSDSLKWNKYDRNTLPMWVADTDFRSPPCITEALQRRVAHGVFGYGDWPHALADTAIDHFWRSYGWRVEKEWLVFLPGIVSGLNLCVRSFAGGGTLAPDPIYPPFRKAAMLAGCSQLNAPVIQRDGRPYLDLPSLEPRLTGREKLLMLCNPQNPGGTVWRREELEQQLTFAQRHDMIVCSDEIHCELLLEPGARHIPFATLGEDAAQRSITLVSPSKTYNIAGLGASLAIIPNPELRRRFCATREGIVPSVDVLALTAAEAAWRAGEPWRAELLNVLRANRDALCQAINALPGLSVTPPEATYLAWVDASALGEESPVSFFRRAGLGFSPGADFGNPAFVRINFGCTRATLDEAINRLNQALKER